MIKKWLLLKNIKDSVQNHTLIYDQNGLNQLKSIPYLWPKRLRNHILWGRTYLYSPYQGVPPRGNINATVLNTNLLLTEREGRTREHWPEVVAVRTKRSEVRTKTTEGQYSSARLELARLVSSLLYGTRAMFVLNFPAFENKKYAAYDPFPRKRSVWRNPDQERTNQNARICLAI